MVVDATSTFEHPSALIELISLLREFNRPCALLFNKIDLLDEKSRENLQYIEKIYNFKELQLLFPGLIILPYSAFLGSTRKQFLAWLLPLLDIFGFEQKKQKTRSCFFK